jgi:hypothetical protein
MGSVVQVSKVLPKDAGDLTWQDGGKETRVLGTLDVSLHHPSLGEAFGGVCAGPEDFSHHIFLCPINLMSEDALVNAYLLYCSKGFHMATLLTSAWTSLHGNRELHQY